MSKCSGVSLNGMERGGSQKRLIEWWPLMKEDEFGSYFKRRMRKIWWPIWWEEWKSTPRLLTLTTLLEYVGATNHESKSRTGRFDGKSNWFGRIKYKVGSFGKGICILEWPISLLSYVKTVHCLAFRGIPGWYNNIIAGLWHLHRADLIFVL